MLQIGINEEYKKSKYKGVDFRSYKYFIFEYMPIYYSTFLNISVNSSRDNPSHASVYSCLQCMEN